MQAVWINPEEHVWEEKIASHASQHASARPKLPLLKQPLTVRHLTELCDHLLA
jgi:hypothetical protein